MKKTVLALCLFVSSYAVQATEYLGFDLGVASKAKVVEQLKSAGAQFETDWSYRGYAELPMVKVLSHQRFAKFGALNHAWLLFAQGGELYALTAEYADEGATFKMFKDALDSKYGKPRQSGFGFQTTFHYRDGKAEITLTRDTFGFGAEQKTSIRYAWAPLAAQVQRTRDAIEADIRAKNAKKAGSDL